MRSRRCCRPVRSGRPWSSGLDGPRPPRALDRRARITLACACGKSNTPVRAEVSLSMQSVEKWRSRLSAGSHGRAAGCATAWPARKIGDARRGEADSLATSSVENLWTRPPKSCRLPPTGSSGGTARNVERPGGTSSGAAQPAGKGWPLLRPSHVSRGESNSFKARRIARRRTLGDYLDRLSEFVAETRFGDMSPDAVAAVKDVMLDTFGVMIAGSRLPDNAAFAKLAAQRSGRATATILGHQLKAEPMLATLVNATAGVSLEMDEGNSSGGGHPAIHVLPGALATAEEMGVGGRELIESILVGYEAGSRIGGATRLRHGINPLTHRRWDIHPHGPYATLSTAVAVAKLKNYTPGQVRAVINLASSMSPANTWTPCFEGATIRNLFSGRSGFQGILAVHLYECGYTGLRDGPTDIFGSILGEQFDQEAVVEGLGKGEYRIQRNYFKFHACCRINHPALDAVMQACQGADFTPHDVESVEVVTPTMHPGMLGDYPHNMLGAKFNVPYAVAAAVVRRATDVTSFYQEAIDSDRIRSLAGKVRVTVDPDAPASPTGSQGPLAVVSIHLKDGRTLEGTTSIVRGDYGNRVPREELLDKFHFLNDDILGRKRTDAVIRSTDRLEELRDVRELTSLLGG